MMQEISMAYWPRILRGSVAWLILLFTVSITNPEFQQPTADQIVYGIAAADPLGSHPVANRSDSTETKIAVLIIDGQNNHGTWPKTTQMMKQYLEQSGRFEVDIARTRFTWQGKDYLEQYPLDDGIEYQALDQPRHDPDFKPDFSRYQLVVNNFGFGAAPLPEATQQSLSEFVRSGGGLVSVHAADNCWPDWKDYNVMIGVGGWGGRSEKSGPAIYLDQDGNVQMDTTPGPGGSHGAQHDFVVTVRQADHPIMAGLPRGFLHGRDELYDRLRGPARDVKVLASAFSSKQYGGTDRHEPVLMTIPFGQGRVFHTILGHADYSMESVAFITTFLRGCEWAVTGEVTLPVPDDFPDSSRLRKRDFAAVEESKN